LAIGTVAYQGSWFLFATKGRFDGLGLKGQAQCWRLPHEWGLGKGKNEAKPSPRKICGEAASNPRPGVFSTFGTCPARLFILNQSGCLTPQLYALN